MSADFNAGSIEGTLDLDTAPFKAGLRYAKAEAKKFADTDIEPSVGLDRKGFVAEKDKTKAELDALGKKKVEPEVKLSGASLVLAKLKAIQHETEKTDRGAMVGMVLRLGLMSAGLLGVVAAAGPATAALVAFGAAGALAFGGIVVAAIPFALALKGAVKQITDANKAGKELTGWAGKAQSGLKTLTDEWSKLQKAVAPQMFHLLGVTFQTLTGILPKLAPLIRTVATGLTGVVKQVGHLLHSNLFSGFLKQLQQFMGGFLKGVGPVLTNLLKTFFNLFSALRPLMSQLGHGILIASDAVAKFSRHLKNGGIDGFMSRMEKFLPLLGHIAGDLLHTLGSLGKSIAPLAGPALRLIDSLVKSIGRVNLKPLAVGIGQLFDGIRSALPTIVSVLNKVTPLLGKVLGWAGGMLKHKAVVDVILGLVGAFLAYKAALGLYNTGMKIAGAVTKAYSAAQWLLNAAMDANPIGIVVVALGALVAGLIYAYKHSETFRKIVDAAFHWVAKTAKSVFNWLKNAVGDVIDFIKHHWQLLISIFGGPLGIVVGLVIKHFGSIKDAITSAINHVVGFLKGAWHTIQSGWDAMGRAMHSIYDHVIHPIFDFFEKAIGHTVDAFHHAVDGIKKAWSAVEGAAKAPVKFVVNTVIDKGVIGSLNKVGGFFHLPSIPEVHLPFARGGFVPGHAPSDEADNVHAMVTPGEFMVRRKSARKIEQRHPGALAHINATGDLPKYGLGGWIKGAGSAVGHAASGAFGWAKDTVSKVNPVKWVEDHVKGLLDKVGGGAMGDLAKAAGSKVLDGALTWLKSKVGMGGGVGGGAPAPGSYGAGVTQWTPQILRALAMLHQPASLLGAVLHRMMQESGGNPMAINNWDSNAAAGDPSRGLMQTIGSTFAAYAGPFRGAGIYNPMANIYAGLNYALHRYGSIYAAMMKPGGYASGTKSARPGWAWVGENGPELMRFRGGEQVMSHPASVAATGPSGDVSAKLDRMIELLAGILSKNTGMTAADRKALIQAARAA